MDIVIAAALIAAHNMNKADKINQQATTRNIRAFTKEAEAERLVKSHETAMDEAFNRLAVRKNGILSTSMQRFLNVYERIIKINWNSTDNINKLALIQNCNEISSLRTSVSVALSPLTKTERVVRFVCSPLFISDKMEAEENLQLARRRSSFANASFAQAQLVATALDGFTRNANQMTDQLTALNVLFMKSILTTEELIDQKGYSRENYSENDRRSLQNCMNLASAIKKIIDTPIMNKDGELNKKSIDLINESQALINRLK